MFPISSRKASMQIPCVRSGLFLAIGWVLAVCVGCGGGDSSVTSYSGNLIAATTVSLDTPTGSNTTEVVVDGGPGSFSFGAMNTPYVTVTVCAPNSTKCVTLDHVFLDTGSYGLRVLKSRVSALSLPAMTLAADAQLQTPAGTVLECYPFVLGGLWGPMARADVHMAGETATAIPIQLIDDTGSTNLTVPDDCIAAAGGRSPTGQSPIFDSAQSLQANGILGIGMMGFDCGVTCVTGSYAEFHIQYYVCPDGVTANCRAAAIPIDQQTQNPVVHFVPDDGNPQPDNNGTIISLPALPALGAGVAKGRLVFGIGTRSNNQIAPGAKILSVDANPLSPSYLYFTTTLGSMSYPYSYIDSGSNAYFFNDASIRQACASSAGALSGGWYCPPGTASALRSAIMSDVVGSMVSVDFSIANADVLFSGSSSAFANLGGSLGLDPLDCQVTKTCRYPEKTFVWGLSFFFGRSVYTSIWGQALSTNGPWNAF